MRALKRNGIVEPEFLYTKLEGELRPVDFERELAALLRMEMISIEKGEDKINIQLRR